MKYLKSLILLLLLLPGLSAPAFAFGGSFFGGVSRPQLESNTAGFGSDMVGVAGGAGTVTEALAALDLDSVQRFATIADLRAATAPSYARVVYLVERGGGAFVWDSSDLSTEVVADTQSGIYVAPDSDLTGATGAWVRQYQYVGAMHGKWFGAACDYSTDDSIAVQAVIDANRGGVTVIDSGATFAGVVLNGSTYDNSTIIIEDMLLLPRVGTTNNFQGAAWVGVALQETTNVSLVVKNADGNLSGQTDEQHVYVAGLAGTSNTKIPLFNFRNVRGDGLYVSGADWAAGGNPDTGLSIGHFSGENAADNGRNALSIINATDWSIDYFRSHRIGGTVGAVVMPGGLDVEPNLTTQEVRRGVVGTVDIVSNGNFGLSIDGEEVTVAARDFNVSDINIIGGTVVNTNGQTGLFINKAININVDVTAKGDGTTRCAAVVIEEADRITGNIKTRHTTDAITVGYNTLCTKINLNIDCTDFQSSGLRPVLVNDSEFSGRVSGPDIVGNRFGVWLRDFNVVSANQHRVKYSVTCDNSGGDMVRGYRNDPTDPMVFTDCLAHDIDLESFTAADLGMDNCGTGFRKSNVRGVTNNVGHAGGSSAWAKGDIITNDTPTIDVNNMVILGWIKLTDGTANVTGTDWALLRASHASPAN